MHEACMLQLQGACSSLPESLCNFIKVYGAMTAFPGSVQSAGEAESQLSIICHRRGGGHVTSPSNVCFRFSCKSCASFLIVTPMRIGLFLILFYCHNI